jgi:phage terminase large subunit
MSGARLERLRYGRRVIDVEGSYYGKLLHEAKEGGRLGSIRPDPSRAVDTSWDLGVADFTTIWFWQQGGAGQHWAVDYYEMSGEGLGHFARVLQRKRDRFGYVYGTFYLPHDVEQRVQAFEVETRLDVMRRLFPGIRLVVVPRVPDVAERIEAMRNLIPRTCFDTSNAPPDDPEARNTAQGVQRLIAYKREYNEALGTFAARPKHDEASHAADGAGTYAQGYGTGVVQPLPEATVTPRHWQRMGSRRPDWR